MKKMKFLKKIFLFVNAINQEKLDLIYFYIMTVNEIQIHQINKSKTFNRSLTNLKKQIKNY